MNTAKVFQSGNSQAVRLPKAFRFDATEVEIFRRGDEVVLREKKRLSLVGAFDQVADLPDDFDILDLVPEEREGLRVALRYLLDTTIRVSLAESGKIIAANDLWTAAHARAAGLIVVTNNEREFCRVPGLKVENWAGGHG